MKRNFAYQLLLIGLPFFGFMPQLPKQPLAHSTSGCFFEPDYRHDFHTSITQIQYNPKENIWEISMRLFTDDFERTLTLESKSIIHLHTQENHNTLVHNYFKKHFSILSPQGQKLPYRYLGKEQEGSATWLYIEIAWKANESLTNYKIQNDILLELFSDQTNIVNLNFGNVRKSYLFNKNNKEQSLL